jgi:hypothetical protein
MNVATDLDEQAKFNRELSDSVGDDYHDPAPDPVAAINEHAQRVASVIASKVIIAEQLGHLRELFAPVTPVLTQLNGGGQK